jgi:AcrR family transcriptional regulator
MKKLEAVFGHEESVEDKIIEATVKCFRRFGINKTSMDDIAKAAKLSRPTIYRYFPSRHHLAVEVLVREVRDHTRLVLPILKQHRYPPKALVEGILFDLATAKEHPYTGILVSDEGAELLAKVDGSDEQVLAVMSEQWLPSLARWREDGYLRPGVKLDDILLWITLFMYQALSKTFFTIPTDRVRRLITTMFIPAIFDLDALKRDFPKEQ